MTIPVSEWQWFGNAGHFICSESCRFHLCTKVGPWLVSTVGQLVFHVDRTTGERKFEPLGCYPSSLYETMVFRAEPSVCTSRECLCGIPDHNGRNLDSERYATAGAAAAGHMEFCRKWAEQEDGAA